MFLNRLFVIFAFLICYVRSDEQFKPKKAKTSHYYRDQLFLSNEGQSCADISDHRKVDRTVHFCTLPVPEFDTWTTLSFWGWQNLKPSEKRIVSVQLYSVSDTNEETFQFKISIKRDSRTKSDDYVKWYRHDFIISNKQNETNHNITGIKLYYSVSAGKHNEINLRDVWVRPMSQVSIPPLHCSETYHNKCLLIMSICMGFYMYLSFISFRMMKESILRIKSMIILNANIDVLELALQTMERDQIVLRCNMFLVFLYVVMSFVEGYFFKGYPFPRCKNDTLFVGIVISHSSFFLIWILFCRPLFPFQVIAGTKGMWLIILNITESLYSNLDIIKIATLNLKKKERTIPFEKIHVYSTNEENNKCPICIKAYSSLRPAIIMECGHIWCSQCIRKTCLLEMPFHTGSCPTCRSMVSYENGILYDVNVVITNTTTESSPTINENNELANTPYNIPNNGDESRFRFQFPMMNIYSSLSSLVSRYHRRNAVFPDLENNLPDDSSNQTNDEISHEDEVIDDRDSIDNQQQSHHDLPRVSVTTIAVVDDDIEKSNETLEQVGQIKQNMINSLDAMCGLGVTVSLEDGDGDKRAKVMGLEDMVLDAQL